MLSKQDQNLTLRKYTKIKALHVPACWIDLLGFSASQGATLNFFLDDYTKRTEHTYTNGNAIQDYLRILVFKVFILGFSGGVSSWFLQFIARNVPL